MFFVKYGDSRNLGSASIYRRHPILLESQNLSKHSLDILHFVINYFSVIGVMLKQVCDRFRGICQNLDYDAKTD